MPRRLLIVTVELISEKYSVARIADSESSERTGQCLLYTDPDGTGSRCKGRVHYTLVSWNIVPKGVPAYIPSKRQVMCQVPAYIPSGWNIS